MSAEDVGKEESVQFLYTTMLQRDPKKRRVKPVDKSQLQLDFAGLDDSEDDSDFEFNDNKVAVGGSDESDTGSDDSDSDDDDSDADSDDDSDDASDTEDKEDALDSEAETPSVPPTEDSVSLGDFFSVSSKLKDIELSTETRGSEDGSGTYGKKLKVVICTVCLGDLSEEDNEIVECDGCGVSVHEGCYGISESQSVASTESSASTEPWFCDACKADNKPYCELCPNLGGIFKETDAGRWVHIVCALYTPGVAFGDVDKLNLITLFEMSYNRWGARECCLCEDSRFSWTGVCIGCDAGMCRNYFHVTCAQKEGLLSEAAPDEEIADPFYAYCKQHAEKNVAKAKRRNWLAIQSRAKHRADIDIDDEKEKFRVMRKLRRHKQKYLIHKENRPPSWIPTEKMPRLLTTSASAVRRLMKKAELLGIHNQSETNTKDVRKRQHVAAAFSSEFIGYYLERNNKVTKLKDHIQELRRQGENLQKQEAQIRVTYDKLHSEVNQLRKINEQEKNKTEKLWKTINTCAKKPFPLPKLLEKPKQPVTTLTTKTDIPKSPPHVIHQCSICEKTHNQHMLAKCDQCKLYYHLGCLDPPLTRMPKQTKQFAWQCSECVSSSSEDSDDPDVDTEAPRKLRENIKCPAKFTPIIIRERKKFVKRRRKKKRVIKKIVGEFGEVLQATPKTPPKKRARQSTITATEGPPLITECCVCLKEGDDSNLIRCDECMLCYHFQCLDPPLKKSPKKRGYSWHCTACDPTESSDDDYIADSPEPIIKLEPSVEKRKSPVMPTKSEKTEEVVLKREFKRKSTSPFQRNLVQSDHEKSVSPDKEVSVPVRESKRNSTSPFHRKYKEAELSIDVTMTEEIPVRESKRSSTSPFCRKNKETVEKSVEISTPLKSDKDEALESKEPLIRESKRNSTSPFHRKNKQITDDNVDYATFTVPETKKKKITPAKKKKAVNEISEAPSKSPKSEFTKTKSGVNIKITKSDAGKVKTDSQVPSKKEPPKKTEKQVISESKTIAKEKEKTEENKAADKKGTNVAECVPSSKDRVKIAEIKFHGKEVKEIGKLAESKLMSKEKTKRAEEKASEGVKETTRSDRSESIAKMQTQTKMQEKEPVQSTKSNGLNKMNNGNTPDKTTSENTGALISRKDNVSLADKVFGETYSRKKTAVKMALDTEGTLISSKKEEKQVEETIMEISAKPNMEKTASPERELKRKPLMASPIHPKKAKLLAHQARQEEEMKQKNKAVSHIVERTGPVKQSQEKQSFAAPSSFTFSEKDGNKAPDRSRFGKGSKLEKIARQLSTGTIGLHTLDKSTTSAKSLSQDQARRSDVRDEKPESPAVALDLSKTATTQKPVSLVDKFKDRYTPQYEDISDPESLENLEKPLN